MPIDATSLGVQVQGSSTNPTGKRYVVQNGALVEKQYGFWTRVFGPKTASRDKNTAAADFVRNKLADLENSKTLYAGIGEIATKQLIKLHDKGGLRLSGTSIQCVTNLANFCQKGVDDHLEKLKSEGVSDEVIERIKERLHQDPHILGKVSERVGIGRWVEEKGGGDATLSRDIANAINKQIRPAIDDLAQKHLKTEIDKLREACLQPKSLAEQLNDKWNKFDCNPDLSLLQQTDPEAFEKLFDDIVKDARKGVEKSIQEAENNGLPLCGEGEAANLANWHLKDQISKKTGPLTDNLESENRTSTYATQHPVGSAVIRFAGSYKPRLVAMKPGNEETLHQLACGQLKSHPGLEAVEDPQKEIESFENLPANLKKSNPFTVGPDKHLSATAFSNFMNNPAGKKSREDCNALCAQWEGIKKTWGLEGHSSLAKEIKKIRNGDFYRECESEAAKAKGFLDLCDRVEEHARKGISRGAAFEMEWMVKEKKFTEEVHAQVINFLELGKAGKLSDDPTYQSQLTAINKISKEHGLTNVAKELELIHQDVTAKSSRSNKSQSVSQMVESRAKLLEEEGKKLVENFLKAYEPYPWTEIAKIGAEPKEKKLTPAEKETLQEIHNLALSLRTFGSVFSGTFDLKMIQLHLSTIKNFNRNALEKLENLKAQAWTENTIPALKDLMKLGNWVNKLTAHFSEKKEGDMLALDKLRATQITNACAVLNFASSPPANQLLPSLFAKGGVFTSQSLIAQQDNQYNRAYGAKCGTLLQSSVEFLSDVKTSHTDLRDAEVEFLKVTKEVTKLFDEIPKLAETHPGDVRTKINEMRTRLVTQRELAKSAVEKVREMNARHTSGRKRMARMAEDITGRDKEDKEIKKSGEAVRGDGDNLIKEIDNRLGLLAKVEFQIGEIDPRE